MRKCRRTKRIDEQKSVAKTNCAVTAKKEKAHCPTRQNAQNRKGLLQLSACFFGVRQSAKNAARRSVEKCKKSFATKTTTTFEQPQQTAKPQFGKNVFEVCCILRSRGLSGNRTIVAIRRQTAFKSPFGTPKGLFTFRSI